MKPKVLLDPAFRKVHATFSPENLAAMHEFADVVWAKDEPIPDEELEKLKPELVAILAGWWHHGDLKDYPKLRAFMELGGGLPSPASFDYATAFARQVRVLSCAPAFGPMVAEMGLILALNCIRQAARTDREFRSGTEPWSHEQFRGEYTLFGKKVGFIGFGGLARWLRKLLGPWEVDLSVYDPWMTDAYLHVQGVRPAPLEAIMSESDVIFVLAVPSGANKALLSRDLLETIRPGRALVLLSRAHLVDFDALTELVLAGRFFAGIDVFPEEPLVADHPIRQAEHAVLSSHRAGAQEESIRAIGTLATRDLEAVVKGYPPREMQSAEWEYLNLRG